MKRVWGALGVWAAVALLVMAAAVVVGVVVLEAIVQSKEFRARLDQMDRIEAQLRSCNLPRLP